MKENEGIILQLDFAEKCLHKGLIKSLRINDYAEKECDFQLCIETLKKHSNEIKFILTTRIGGKIKLAIQTK